MAGLEWWHIQPSGSYTQQVGLDGDASTGNGLSMECRVWQAPVRRRDMPGLVGNTRLN